MSDSDLIASETAWPL